MRLGAGDAEPRLGVGMISGVMCQLPGKRRLRRKPWGRGGLGLPELNGTMEVKGV